MSANVWMVNQRQINHDVLARDMKFLPTNWTADGPRPQHICDSVTFISAQACNAVIVAATGDRSRSGSWSQCMLAKPWQFATNRLACREVLDCASPLALWVSAEVASSYRKRQRAGALQDAGATDNGSEMRGAIGSLGLFSQILWALCVVVGCNGCKPSNSAATAKSPPPAKVAHVAKEESLANIILTAEAEQRLGIAVAPAVAKKVTRTRTFGGELLVALGRPWSGNAAGGPAPKANQGQSIYSLLPAMTPTEMIRVAEIQLEADGQAAAARVHLQAAQVALKRSENLLAEKAGSIRAVDEVKAQVALAETALQTALSRRELLGAPLFEAVKQDVLWVRVPVYVGDVQQIKSSANARVGNLGTRTNHASRIAKPVAVPISGSNGSATVDLFYEVENKDATLRAGQKVAVQIPLTGEEEALAVPVSALLYDIHGGTWVYENTIEHGFTRRRVEVRFVESGEAILGRGLHAGAKIVTAGATELFGAEFGFGK